MTPEQARKFREARVGFRLPDEYWQQVGVEAFAGAVAVIKNLLTMRTISGDEAAQALWDLINEVNGGDIMYVPMSSPTIERLVLKLHEEGRWPKF